MRLHSIKLAGFKSFVDPTTVHFPANLSAVVGPNGCGKSNIIDAVRWVMGESSAKQLRGESLDDVIFNGSVARKPVGQAAIELNFDNSDGTLTGQYASYTEISIRREITRDGQSTYFLNSTRCRRRDIIDIFLGTGLGPRSYAIIEQGMISRLIEAKPEELRSYLEEAAGISKYKERKHETELRIKHTQENLARLNDVREELEKQLDHLQRQANAAERYKVLKQEERVLKAQILALRYRALQQQFQQQAADIEKYQQQLAEKLAQQQELESQLEQQRELQNVTNAQSSESQAQYYRISNEVTQLEQTIQHQTERCAQWRNEQQELVRNTSLLQQQLDDIEQAQIQLSSEVATIDPEVIAAQQKSAESQTALLQAEQALHTWQMDWEKFNHESAETEQRVHVEQTRIQHLTQHLQIVEQRIARLQQEHQQQSQLLNVEPESDLERQSQTLQIARTECEQSLQKITHEIASQRENNQRLLAELDNAKNQSQTLHGQLASLEALQQAALGQNEELVVDWLQQQRLADKQRLAQTLQVETGWEQAIETVLERYLQAVCVEDLTELEQGLAQLPQGNLTFVAKVTEQASASLDKPEYTSLLSKVQAAWSLAPLLAGIYVTETLAEALSLSTRLSAHESIITRDGVWLGKNWLLVAHKADEKTGVLKRERERHELTNALATMAEQIQQRQAALAAGEERVRELERQREVKQQEAAELIAQHADLRAQQQVLKARYEQAGERVRQINVELEDCAEQLAADQKALLLARESLEQAQQDLAAQSTKREELVQVKTQYQSEQDAARQQANADKEAAHQLALRLQAAKLQLETGVQNRARLQQQLQQINERQEFLQQTIAESDAPLAQLREQVETLIEQRAVADEQLKNIQQQVEALEQTLRQLEKQRHEIDQHVVAERNNLEQAKLAGQALEVRSTALQEQVQESGAELETILNELPADAHDNISEDQLNSITRKIDRLGPINLAAIDEFTTLQERKTYLDTQYTDLTEALATLEDAISKMDKETRTRFKDTFDLVNNNFQTLFPRLFGGGRASLEMGGDDDLLLADVTVMAQPPGKRNSTIHLLSGGEKALTAIALVFSLFQLNPAPFCILDEVDAPLDDANVVRFCNLVREMSEKVQFIFISHNKLAIEMGQHLAGVTMQEAGVSRLVAVDMEEAIALATA